MAYQKPEKTANDFHPEVLKLFDRYVHGNVDRRDFLTGVAKFAIGGVTALGLLKALSPNFASAEQVSPNDHRVKAEYRVSVPQRLWKIAWLSG